MTTWKQQMLAHPKMAFFVFWERCLRSQSVFVRKDLLEPGKLTNLQKTWSVMCVLAQTMLTIATFSLPARTLLFPTKKCTDAEHCDAFCWQLTPSSYSHSQLLLAINNLHVLSIPMHSVIRRSGWCLVLKLLEPRPAAAAAHSMPNDGDGPDRGMWGGICFGSNYHHHLKRFSMQPPCKWCQWCSAAENGLMEVQGGVGCVLAQTVCNVSPWHQFVISDVQL